MTTQEVVVVVWVAVAVTLAVHAQVNDRAEVTLQAAIKQELVNGDLAGAIKQYQAIVSTYGKTNRPVAAQALLRLADAYQKQGDAQARTVLEDLLARYADQQDIAAQARTRLTAMAGRARAADTVVARQVWSGPSVDLSGSVSADGRWVSFQDPETGNLAVRDLEQGTTRLLTQTANPPGGAVALGSAVSKDGRRVAFSWASPNGYELRVANLQGDANVRTVLKASGQVQNYQTHDWAPDGRTVAVYTHGRDGRGDQVAQLVLVNSDTAAVQVLRTVDWGDISRVFFSPDGRYLALTQPTAPGGGDTDITCLPVDGSAGTVLASHPAADKVLGWSPDGATLLFASDRNRSLDLWSLPVKDCREAGAPRLVKANIGNPQLPRGLSAVPLGVTTTGRLFLGAFNLEAQVRVAPFDRQAARIGAPAEARTVDIHQNPDWSRDGRSLAFVTVDEAARPSGIGIQSLTSSTYRRLQTKLQWVRRPRWSPDSSSLLAQGWDGQGANGLYRIDATTGAPTLIVGRGQGPDWSASGTSIYYMAWANGVPVFIERNLSTGVERTVTSRPGLGAVSVSPDGRSIATTGKPVAGQGAGPQQSSVVLVVPVDGGVARELFPVSSPQTLDPDVSWLPDGRALFVRKYLDPRQQASEFWLVPLDGTPATRATFAGAQPPAFAPVRFSPDGTRVAFDTTVKTQQVIALEGVLTTGAR